MTLVTVFFWIQGALGYKTHLKLSNLIAFMSPDWKSQTEELLVQLIASYAISTEDCSVNQEQ